MIWSRWESMFLLINKFSSSWLFMFEQTVLVAESGVLCIIYSSLKKEETVGHYLCALCCFSYRYADIDAMFARSRRVDVSPSWNGQEINCSLKELTFQHQVRISWFVFLNLRNFGHF